MINRKPLQITESTKSRHKAEQQTLWLHNYSLNNIRMVHPESEKKSCVQKA